MPCPLNALLMLIAFLFSMFHRLLAQEVVRFCRTMNAPAAGMFCQGELGPLPTLVGGILPNTRRSRLQAFSTCTAVLYWNPGPAEIGDGFLMAGMGVV